MYLPNVVNPPVPLFTPMNDQVGISLYNISTILSKRVMRIKKISINPLSPTSDLDRISPYTISTISSIQVMRIKKNIN